MRFIPNAVTSKVGLVALKLSQHSPNILFGAGVAGVVGTVVLASRATLQLESVIDAHNIDMDKVNDVALRDVENQFGRKFTDQEIYQAKIGVYIKTVGRVIKLYAPAAGVGLLSIAALTKAHFILTKRNAALAAALTAVEKAFRTYRDRVVNDLGREKDEEYYYGTEKRKTTVVDSDGKKKSVTTRVQAAGINPYSVLFHSGNRNWVDSPGMNLIFLKIQQDYLNDQLNAKGWVTLNDVYDALGFDRTKAGTVVGWKLGNGDNRVDLGIFHREELGRAYEYITNDDGEIWINPNPDGNIFNKLED